MKQQIAINPQNEIERTAQTEEQALKMRQAKAAYVAQYYRPTLRNTLRNLVKRTVSFCIAISSPLWKKQLSSKQYEARLVACLGCSKLQQSPKSAIGFCQACGCKATRFSDLTVKANLPGAKCPEGKWASSKALSNG